MSWHASLRLDYACEQRRTVARFAHEGPLRILQSMYPEGDAVCHNVLVHPPGGLVGGDALDVQLQLAEGTHALVTTPGASRFYRSEGAAAVQAVQVHAAAGARLEWLPLEALYYSGCIARNELRLTLAPGAEVIAWDVAALGLPQAGQAFLAGEVQQHLEIAGRWLERGRIAADDAHLMDGPLGLAGHRCMGTLWFACGDVLSRARRDAALEAARACIAGSALEATAGATSPEPGVIVVRVLAPLVEPAMQLLRTIRCAWRGQMWNLPGIQPRGWSL